MPHRITIPTAYHKALFMPARINTIGSTMKVVSVPSCSDDAGGLPASTIVLDNPSGAVKAIVNARNLTALRNAGGKPSLTRSVPPIGSLLSTTLVGPKEPDHIVAFGAGQQISAHLDVHFREFPTIKTCTIVNRSLNSRVERLIAKLKDAHPSVKTTALALNAEDGNANMEVKEELARASIIITATSSKAPLFPSSWVPTGAHIILIGSYTKEMKEVDTDLVMRAVRSQVSDGVSPRLLVDSVEACFQEAGELLEAGLNEEQTQEIGSLVLDARAQNDQATPSEMRKILCSGLKETTEKEAATFDGPVTMFKSVGLGLQDVAIACAVVEQAEKMIAESSAADLGVIVDSYDQVI
ncbi:hypothetical protein AAF712_005999 [Marasmius tenuissimus]|uniref:Thiomorpholine-carboxylate dehydrogenase n=1 Tax=Marasmius tenuissimus TaxID=585030 RepID=A0ABR3A0F9_9AGAR